MRILLTGGTGWIGREVGKLLVGQGHEVVALVRNPDRARAQMPFPARLVSWQGNLSPAKETFSGVEAVIHLAGEPVVGSRWTQARKQLLWSSRVTATENLVKGILDSGAPVRTFLSASAIGIYGDRGDEILDEASAPAADFLSNLCHQWEGASEPLRSQGLRVANLRIGLVLGQGGGFLGELEPIFRLGLGGRLSGGEQWLSWIHQKDLLALILWALESPLATGPINCVAPHPVRNRDFTREFAQILGRPAAFAVPAFALKISFGEMAQVLLGGQRVSAKVASAAGFGFQFPDLQLALKDLYSSMDKGDECRVFENWFPEPLDRVFGFFSNEKNLELITPPWLNFKVVKKSTARLEEGTLIDYRLSLHGVPMGWRSQITAWDPNRQFVDEQIKGPYRKWQHYHQFSQLGNGTLMTDKVVFRLPLGWLGQVAGGWFVRRDVQRIFSYRHGRIGHLLGSPN